MTEENKTSKSTNSIYIQKPQKSAKSLRIGPWALNPHPVIRDSRLRKLGLRTEKNLSPKVAGYWRISNLSAKDSMELFFPCYQEKLNELKYNEFTNLPGQEDITDQHIREAIAALTEDQNWLNREKNLNKINPQLIKYLAKALYGQFSRGTLPWLENAAAWDDLTPRQWVDFFGKHEVNEIIEILQASQFFKNISLDIKGNNFKLTLSIPDSEQIDIVTGKTNEDGNISFTINKDTPPEHVDNALQAMVDLVCSHRQSNNSNVVTLTMGNSVEEVIRLAQLFLCGGHMHLDLSKVNGPIYDKLASISNPQQKENLTKLWGIINDFSKAYDPKDSKNISLPPARGKNDAYPNVPRTKVGISNFLTSVLNDNSYFTSPSPATTNTPTTVKPI